MIKVWGGVMWLYFSADCCCCPRQIQYCKREKKEKKKLSYDGAIDIYLRVREKSQWPRLIC